jgi:hypothetical protein
MKYLTSCSLVKNEFPYIVEFYQIHKFLGVEHFVFFDRSTEGPALSKIFENYPDVEVHHFPEGNQGFHADAWKAGVDLLKGRSKWVQFVDIDQVVVPMQTLDIKEMLVPYEVYGSLGLNWHSFGSNGKKKEPKNESTYSTYTKRANGNHPINSHIQSIVQVDKAQSLKWHDPHHPILESQYIQVNENKIQFTGPFNNPPTQNVGFIAHYYTRSFAYWKAKCDKGRADCSAPGGRYDQFDHHQEYMNEVEDLTVKKIWESI